MLTPFNFLLMFILVGHLQKELNQIKADIERNETSIFDDKNKDK